MTSESTRHRLKHPGDKVYACPECDIAPVYVRVQSNRTIGDLPFACHHCSIDFSLPNLREKKANNGNKSDGLRALENANPEEIGL